MDGSRAEAALSRGPGRCEDQGGGLLSFFEKIGELGGGECLGRVIEKQAVAIAFQDKAGMFSKEADDGGSEHRASRCFIRSPHREHSVELPVVREIDVLQTEKFSVIVKKRFRVDHKFRQVQ